mmetsp:Transcript_47348/g.71680  ORF Transcript_47348/g.71680 Transcript_47348/m.71680 type:complete len:134 (-) Transcript_47348:404-805(-)
MARTFIFIYSYALPFALADSMIQPVGAMLVIFFITYGFLGLEFVAMELDDPFGDDPNDFDNLGMARVRVLSLAQPSLFSSLQFMFTVAWFFTFPLLQMIHLLLSFPLRNLFQSGRWRLKIFITTSTKMMEPSL